MCVFALCIMKDLPPCCLVHTGHNVHKKLRYVKARQSSARPGSLDSSSQSNCMPSGKSYILMVTAYEVIAEVLY